MVPDEGIEPPTFGLQNRCTTAVLIRRRVSHIVRGALRQGAKRKSTTQARLKRVLAGRTGTRGAAQCGCRRAQGRMFPGRMGVGAVMPPAACVHAGFSRVRLEQHP